MTDNDCVAFLQWALPRLRMRWPGFRKVRRQVCKRISRRMGELGLEDVGEYRGLLETHEEEWKKLDECCRITISRFFRDREVFQTLQGVVLPRLAECVGREGRTEVRCWSAGCGSGEEPYTLSLIWRLTPDDGQIESLSRRFPRLSLRVTATDAYPKVLDRAREGVYPRGALKDLPPSWLPLAFQEVDRGLSLRPSFREGVSVLAQDIREAWPDGSFDLILCRNLVFTYFEERLQREILESLLHRLRQGGFLVIGGHEAVPEGEWPLTQWRQGLPVFMKGDRPPGGQLDI